MILTTQKWLSTLISFVWDDDLRQLGRLRQLVVFMTRVLYVLARELIGGQLNLRAMSLVYTTLLSIVPLLAVSFSVLKGFGVHNTVEPLLYNLLEPLGPNGVERPLVVALEPSLYVIVGSHGCPLLVPSEQEQSDSQIPLSGKSM